MSVFCLLALLLVAAAPASAVQQVAGELRGVHRWSGEVELTGPVVVGEGAALEIAAGTRVLAAATESLLRVQGTLQVLGTAQAPVVFATPPGWRGLVFERPLAPQLIRHGRFSGAATAIDAQAAQLSLEGVTFHQCDLAVKAVREARLEIRDGRFEDNRVGVDVELKSEVVIQNGQFIANREAGLLAAGGCRLTISDSRFENNGKGLGLLQKVSGTLRANRFAANDSALAVTRLGEGLVVSDNLFEGNRVALSSATFSRPLVTDNRFVGNETAIISDQFAKGEFLHNLFQDNHTALKNTRRADPLVARNVFERNQIAVFCDFASYPRVQNNNFFGNLLAVKLGDFQSAAGARPPGAQRDAENGTQGPMAPLPFAGEQPLQDFVDVSANWWGEDTVLLAGLGETGNPPIFFDRQDATEVRSPNDSAAGGPIDWVRFRPWLIAPVADAGPR
ncbi:right-handed parallel beta-helix repeat-containing protein [Geoalkalibacter sp.]|uniref:right-handed parallel beta-helix repeat-containing protein n=1 Tax=Geoalkalibacter sp. TaxID=3041440 RepID=UPI00272E71E9|nr:right-handed parallel beta-helix repeat-containing protein [Geoalkalibacter sp.]